MTTTKWGVALLAATALTTMASVPVHAQDAETAVSAEESAAQLEFLKAQVDALQLQLDAVKKTAGVITPAWKGAPEFSSGDSGYKFKLSGELQFDAAQISNPGNRLATPNLGWNARSRRILFGASGSLPGDFNYNLQFNLAEGVVDYEDVVIEYAPHKTPFTFTAGYFYPFSSMENMMSNRFTSFVERAQLNETTGNGRRLGIAATYVNKTNDFRIQAGLFNEGINGATALGYSGASTSTSVSTLNAAAGTVATTTTTTTSVAPNNNGLFDRTGYQGTIRTVFSPLFMGGQAHLAASFQFREFKTSARGFQYRARPFSFTTDQRFVSSGSVAAKSDRIIGVETMYIHGPIHVAGEAQYVKVDGYRPGQTVVAPQALLGTSYLNNYDFWTAYAEAGFWFTGETRGYKNGKVDRTKILHSVSDGGPGGLQLVGRVDYINLTSFVNNQAANSFGVVNGGRQIGYLAALNYWPIDYVRFTAEYARSEIKGGPQGANVVPISLDPVSNRTYGTNIFALRAQIDF